ncbi:MAG: hypothetical protein PG977_000656 [Bartonella clarridgeiae]|uniref:autotransporter outer membrane beta-barrel domain-containing protein n=1 Tax=Bartonella clarridgeiae TaxID=56426 RepID=UPI0023F271FC|nr:autotransporter outer membrane beta-barrel domain-containing protein [Bartonella clarridgeiae]WCR55263.1 MAG: hypothetical protein PG977_000656 [Bartonella clarridgeiae]
MKKAFGIKLSLQNIFLLFSTTFIHSAELIADNGRVTSISEDISIESIINSSIINGGKFESKYIGVLANKIGKIDFTGVDITTGLLGVVPYAASRVYLKNSTIRVTNPFGYGIYFRHKETPDDLDPPSQVHLTNTTILSPHIGISSKGSGIVILKNSEIHSNILLTSQPTENTAYQKYNYAEMLRIDADHSVLEGQSKVDGSQYVFLTLKNDSKWIIPTNSNSEKTRQESTLHMLHLYNSSIVFDKKFNGGYQTLHIKTPQEDFISQYFAAGDAKIYFNLGRRDSDKLIIRTNVQGITKVHINHIKDSRETTSAERIDYRDSAISLLQEGITLIEVYGHANENSFKLPHGYITMDGLPYRHILKAIRTPAVSDNSTSLSNWHFKLQDGYIDSQSRVKALVPQMASYLVMPNALFSSGISDISNQNKVLADIRETLNIESKKKGSFFLSSYGNTASLSSIRNPIQYGYGADIGYAALQTGVVLGSFENENTITRVGLLGTYGKVSFTPKDMEDSAKSALDKWSISAFGSVQHDNNLYMNALLSYGIVKGHIKTAVINNVAELDDTKMFSVSTTVGQKLATGAKGVSFEPQAQLVYQSVMFNTILDSDNLQVNMKDPNQWLVRVGGRLTKTVPVVEKDSFISFYGKVNVMKTLSASDTIEVSDTFYLDSMGSAIEGGLGINVQVTKNILFHGDASYQQRLSKAGISGASFAGRLLYRF